MVLKVFVLKICTSFEQNDGCGGWLVVEVAFLWKALYDFQGKSSHKVIYSFVMSDDFSEKGLTLIFFD